MKIGEKRHRLRANSLVRACVNRASSVAAPRLIDIHTYNPSRVVSDLHSSWVHFDIVPPPITDSPSNTRRGCLLSGAACRPQMRDDVRGRPVSLCGLR